MDACKPLSVGDDKQLLLWDTRQKADEATLSSVARAYTHSLFSST